MFSTGFKISSVVTDSLRQAGFIKEGTSYDEIQQHVYKLFDSIAEQQQVNDWLETANGTTYTLTFKPRKQA